MNREEAANYLGISTRTLDRYREQGILPVRYIKGRTRRTPVYESADLDALKARLDPASGIPTPEETKASAPEETRSASASESLGFRIDPVARQRVAEAGAALGMSAGEYARHLVLMGLERLEDEGTENGADTRQLLIEQGQLLQDIVTHLEQQEPSPDAGSMQDALKTAQRQQTQHWQQARQDLNQCVQSIAELSQQMEALAQSVADVRGRIALYAAPKTLTLPAEFALLPEQLTQICESLALIREDVRTATAGILATCARPGEFADDLQEIEQWVTANLPA